MQNVFRKEALTATHYRRGDEHMRYAKYHSQWYRFDEHLNTWEHSYDFNKGGFPTSDLIPLEYLK